MAVCVSRILFIHKIIIIDSQTLFFRYVKSSREEFYHKSITTINSAQHVGYINTIVFDIIGGYYIYEVLLASLGACSFPSTSALL